MSYKKIFIIFTALVLIGIFSISCLIFYTKSYKVETLINLIYKKNHYSKLSDRMTRFYILNKKQDLEYVIMGASSVWVLDPKIVEDKYKFKGAINISQGGAKLTEHYKFILWMLKNKKDLKEILINLEPSSFNNLQYSRLPYEIEISLSDKIANFFSFLSFKDSIKIFLINFNFLSKKKEIIEKGVGDFYFYSGLRFYPRYFERLNDNSLMTKMVNELKNSDVTYLRDSFDNKSFEYLSEIIKLTKGKNIKVKLFFDPVSHVLLKSNNYEYLYSELKIVKKIINELNHEVLYFNNLNEINYSLNLFEDGHHHYNYDAGNLILKEMLNDRLKIGKKISKDNFSEFLDEILKKVKSEKINALY